jgi:hypothetical protein
MRVSFLKAATKIIPPSAQRPLDCKILPQHRRKRWPSINTDLLWGCPQMNFRANPPFNEMKQGFATFKKESRMAPHEMRLYPTF